MGSNLVVKFWGWVYDLIYSGRAPWEMGGPRPDLVKLVENGTLHPSPAIDLGCGTGDNVIYLARHGFSSIGVDISALAINQARVKAHDAGVQARFLVGDVTEFAEMGGPFDLVLDYGCLGCILGTPARKRYVQSLLRLTRAGSIYILLNFTRSPDAFFNLIPNVLSSGEAERLLGSHFEVGYFNGARERGPLGLRVEYRRMRRK
jgi:SAM-dependent methyltransferase